MTQAITPTVGRVEGDTHILSCRVYYEDTDAAGIVYYASYLKFAERARTEFMRCLGGDHGELRDADGLAFAVRRCTVDYLSPVRLDEVITIHTRVTHVGGASLWMDQSVRRDGADVAHLDVRLVCMSADARPHRLPARLRAALSQVCDPSPAAGAAPASGTAKEQP